MRASIEERNSTTSKMEGVDLPSFFYILCPKGSQNALEHLYHPPLLLISRPLHSSTEISEDTKEILSGQKALICIKGPRILFLPEEF